MTYATVMVCLALVRSNDARLEIAGQLVERFGAHVIGVAAGEFSPPLYFTDGEQAQRLLDEGQAAIKSRITEVEAEFRAAMQNCAAAVEWRSAEDFPTRFIVRQARAADIIVVGEDGRDVLGDPFLQANPSDLVMQTGRPLLVVPDTCSWLDLRSVLIAWKDTTEARRAVCRCVAHASQGQGRRSSPKLSRTSRTRLAALSGVKDLVVWLSRHGVVASAASARRMRQMPQSNSNGLHPGSAPV